MLHNYLPGGGSTDHQLLNTVGLASVVIGFVVWIIPWSRWDPKATLVLVPFAFALIVVSDRYGGMSSFSRTPSFSSAGTFERAGGEFHGYNPYAGGGMATRSGGVTEGASGGRYASGSRSACSRNRCCSG